MVSEASQTIDYPAMPGRFTDDQPRSSCSEVPNENRRTSRTGGNCKAIAGETCRRVVRLAGPRTE